MNSAEKLITLLKTLSQQPFEFSVTELSQVVGCGRSGTYKLLAALVAGGMAAQKENRKYCLGMASYLIGKSYEEHVGVWRFAKSYLERLRDETNENVSIAAWSDGGVKVLYKAESHQLIRVVGSVGAGRPINASAMGKTLAAYISWDKIEEMIARFPLVQYTKQTITDVKKLREEYAKIRTNGYAISDREFSADSIGIGAPVRDNTGNVWASISIGAPVLRVNEKEIQRYIRLVKDVAQQISDDLAGRQ